MQRGEFKSYTRTKQYKSLRLNKLKQLLNKDKVGIRQQDLDQPQPEYQRQAEDQPEAEGQPDTEDQTEDDKMGTSPPATRPTSHSPPPRTTDGPPRSPLTTRRHTFQPLDDREQGPVLRNRKDNSLPPGQLDMAAARNPELTRIRIKVQFFNLYLQCSASSIQLLPVSLTSPYDLWPVYVPMTSSG